MKKLCLIFLLLCQFVFSQRQQHNSEKHILFGMDNEFFIDQYAFVPFFLNEAKPKQMILRTHIVQLKRKIDFKDTAKYFIGFIDSSNTTFINSCIQGYTCCFDSKHNVTSYSKTSRCDLKTKQGMETKSHIETRDFSEPNIIRFDTVSHELKKKKGNYQKFYKHRLSSELKYNKDTLIEIHYGYGNKIASIDKYVMNKKRNTTHFLGFTNERLTFETKFQYDLNGKLIKSDEFIYANDTTHISISYRYNKMGLIASIDRNTNNQSHQNKKIEYKLNKNNAWDEIKITTTSSYTEGEDVRTYVKTIIR